MAGLSMRDAAFDGKKVPPKKSLSYLEKRAKNMLPSGGWEHMKAEEHYNAFTVAQSYKADVLQDIYDAVEKAKKEGWSVKKFQEELEPTLKAKGWWGYDVDPKTGKTIELGTPRRLKIILETNLWMSNARGEYQAFIRGAKRRPILKYIQKERKNKNPDHEKFDGKYFKWDDPIVRRIWPPSMYGCGCVMEPMSYEEALKDSGTGKVDIDEILSKGEDYLNDVEKGGFPLQPLQVYDPTDEKHYHPEIKKDLEASLKKGKELKREMLKDTDIPEGDKKEAEESTKAVPPDITELNKIEKMLMKINSDINGYYNDSKSLGNLAIKERLEKWVPLLKKNYTELKAIKSRIDLAHYADNTTNKMAKRLIGIADHLIGKVMSLMQAYLKAKPYTEEEDKELYSYDAKVLEVALKEYPELRDDKYKQKDDRLEREEEVAIRLYTGPPEGEFDFGLNKSYRVNKMLRKGGFDLAPYALTKILGSGILKMKPAKLKTGETMVRYVNFDKEFIARHFKKGKKAVLLGFTSTARERGFANVKSSRVKFVFVNNISGREITHISNHPWQNEILQLPNRVIEVFDIKEEGEQTIITAKFLI